MDVNYSQTRNDFRCGLCRQKNAFHCEHDTPYRDQYLGGYDSNTPRASLESSRRSRSENRKTDHSIHNDGTHTQRQGNSNAAGVRYEQNKTLNKTNGDNHHVNQSSKTNKQKQKSKSCAIL